MDWLGGRAGVISRFSVDSYGTLCPEFIGGHKAVDCEIKSGETAVSLVE